MEESKDAANGLSVDCLTDGTIDFGLFPAPGALTATALIALRRAAGAGARAFDAAESPAVGAAGARSQMMEDESASGAVSDDAESPLEKPMAEELPLDPMDHASWPTMATILGEHSEAMPADGKMTASLLIRILGAARTMAATARLALRTGSDVSIAQAAVARGLQLL